MKILYTAFLLPAFLFSFNSNAQEKSDYIPNKPFVVGFGYELGLPGGDMKKGMRSLHSMKLNMAVPIEWGCERLEAGVELSYGLYGMKTINMKYNFSGNYVNTDVIYNSSIARAGISANYLLAVENKFVPYLSLKTGVAGVFSTFQVEDPRDVSSCRVVEHKSISNDWAAFWGYGAGVRMKLGSKYVENYLDLSLQKVRGGKVNYVNVNRLHHLTDPFVGTGGTPVKFEFVNGSTQQVHEHTVAELYRSPINLFQVAVTYVAVLKF